jgi:hypothetical protein
MEAQMRAIEIGGARYLFDERVQVLDSRYVNLWNTERREMEKFEREAARGVALVSADAVIMSEKEEFEAWVESGAGQGWLSAQKELEERKAESMAQQKNKEEERRLQEEAIRQRRRADLIDRHKSKILRRSRTYQGVRDARPERRAACYACSESLDGIKNPECAACGWLICRCGTCGCGYQTKSPCSLP